MGVIDRIQHAWNAFTDYDKAALGQMYGSSFVYSTPGKAAQSISSSKFMAPIYNRIAIDVSMSKIRHVKVGPENEDVTLLSSGLNYCLTVEANIDQTGIQFMQDLVFSMFDEGVVAVVPVDTTISPKTSDGYDIKSLRVGKIVEWYPEHVRINLYNEHTGKNEDITLQKKMVAIIENPQYAVMNAENSTLKRLLLKMAQLDAQDAASSSGKLDMIIHVPYSVKTDLQRAMAEKRIQEIEKQLTLGRHGITYMDASEKITQINRPIENQLPQTIDRLSNQLYNQLGWTQGIFDGTATEEALRLYYSRTVDPIIENIIAEFYRKFITKTARTQGQELQYFRDMFKFVTIETISSLGDTVRRNSIMTSNEVRKVIGIRPSNDPRADELFNPNIADKNQITPPTPQGSLTPPDEVKTE